MLIRANIIFKSFHCFVFFNKEEFANTLITDPIHLAKSAPFTTPSLYLNKYWTNHVIWNSFLLLLIDEEKKHTWEKDLWSFFLSTIVASASVHQWVLYTRQHLVHPIWLNNTLLWNIWQSFTFLAKTVYGLKHFKDFFVRSISQLTTGISRIFEMF